MIKGIGCDIVDISRIEKVMQNTRSIDKVYTQYDNNGKPFVILHDGAEIVSSNLCIKKIHISISHEDKYAMAFAIVE